MREEEITRWVVSALETYNTQLRTTPNGGKEIILVECVLRSYNSSDTLEVFIDTEAGVTIAECASFSRFLSAEFDANTEIQSLFRSYLRIDVSSPGATRPIRDLRLLQRHVGRRMSVHFFEPMSEQSVGEAVTIKSIEGKLLSCNMPSELDTLGSITLDPTPKPKKGERVKPHPALHIVFSRVKEATVLIEL